MLGGKGKGKLEKGYFCRFGSLEGWKIVGLVGGGYYGRERERVCGCGLGS